MDFVNTFVRIAVYFNYENNFFTVMSVWCRASRTGESRRVMSLLSIPFSVPSCLVPLEGRSDEAMYVMQSTVRADARCRMQVDPAATKIVSLGILFLTKVHRHGYLALSSYLNIRSQPHHPRYTLITVIYRLVVQVVSCTLVHASSYCSKTLQFLLIPISSCGSHCSLSRNKFVKQRDSSNVGQARIYKTYLKHLDFQMKFTGLYLVFEFQQFTLKNNILLTSIFYANNLLLNST